ncbi:MAG: DNA polymerase III subunit chi [Woeseia sp.]
MIGPAMARVDFYLLGEAGALARQNFACRLAEKAWRLKHSVHMLANDAQHARQLDELLWTFRDGSFVPHALAGAEDLRSSIPVPVTIGTAEDGVRPGDLLINLTDELPQSADSFPRIAEVVTSDEDCRQKSRKRFVAYRSQGHMLQTHEL